MKSAWLITLTILFTANNLSAGAAVSGDSGDTSNQRSETAAPDPNAHHLKAGRLSVDLSFLPDEQIVEGFIAEKYKDRSMLHLRFLLARDAGDFENRYQFLIFRIGLETTPRCIITYNGARRLIKWTAGEHAIPLDGSIKLAEAIQAHSLSEKTMLFLDPEAVVSPTIDFFESFSD